MSGFTGINTDYVVSYRKPTDTKNVSQCHGSLDLKHILKLFMLDKTTITCAFETQQKRGRFYYEVFR